MNLRLGHDFSRVRIHTGTDAAAAADAIDARAYTLGRHIVFGSGEFNPSGDAGLRLLAHELTHTVQQKDVDVPPSAALRVADDNDPLELAAEAAAEGAPAATSTSISAPLVLRKGKAKKAPLSESDIRTGIAANNNSDLSEDLLVCLIWKESGFDPSEKNAASSATGLMQMTKGAVTTVNENTPKGVHFTHEEMTSATKNIACGTYYLKIRIKWAGGDTKKGLEGFGTGPGYADNIQACEKCFAGKPASSSDCLGLIHS